MLQPVVSKLNERRNETDASTPLALPDQMQVPGQHAIYVYYNRLIMLIAVELRLHGEAAAALAPLVAQR